MSFYQFTITFPVELFPEVFSEEVSSKFLLKFEKVEECILCEEHGDSGNFHIQGTMSYLSDSVQQVKRFLSSSLGVSQARHKSLPDVIKRRFIVVKKVNYIQGSLNYAIKEGGRIILRKGWTTTWIQEQAAIGAKRRPTLKNRMYLMDHSIDIILKYIADNEFDLQKHNTCDLKIQMEHAGYCWIKVRSVKKVMATLLLLLHDDSDQYREIDEFEMFVPRVSN